MKSRVSKFLALAFMIVALIALVVSPPAAKAAAIVGMGVVGIAVAAPQHQAPSPVASAYESPPPHPIKVFDYSDPHDRQQIDSMYRNAGPVRAHESPCPDDMPGGKHYTHDST